MADEQHSLKFLHDTKMRADTVLGLDHIGAEVKTVIRDLLQICQNLIEVMSAKDGANADVRVLKKRLDAAKADLRAVEPQVETAKRLIAVAVEEIKIIATETNAISKLLGNDANHPIGSSAVKIKNAVGRLAEIIVQARK